MPGIIPTQRAAILIALFAPLALLIAALAPGAWIVAPALGGALLALVVLDALRAGRLVDVRVIAPPEIEVGEGGAVQVMADLDAWRGGRVSAALALDPRLARGGRVEMELAPDEASGTFAGAAELVPVRRGAGGIAHLWLRWEGALGLGARQVSRLVEAKVRVRPSLAAVRSPTLQNFLRDAQFGLVARRMRGEGTEFEALAEYRPGMDRRRIDWKASARHSHLYAKEHEAERNNQIVFAFDCGRVMCEPVDGLPRIDRAVSAALAAAYVALKGGDKVALFGFAARVELLTPFVTQPRDFRRLQEAASELDYRAQEPNFTLALATLASRLQRRSLVVVFSDFTDPTSAELMVESIARLLSRHLVLFVTMADDELEAIAAVAPCDEQALAMAVTADALLRQRALVTRRLRQIGVEVIEAPHAAIGTRLIDAYLNLKRHGAIG